MDESDSTYCFSRVFYILAVMICLLQEIGKSRERVVNYNTIPFSNFRVMFQFVWLLRKFGKRKENIIALNFKTCCLFRTQESNILYTNEPSASFTFMLFFYHFISFTKLW